MLHPSIMGGDAMGLRGNYPLGTEGSNDGADDGHQHGAAPMADAGLGAYRRIELITGEPKRRRWLAAEKANITALSFERGCNISALARRYGVSIGLLHQWRRTARAREVDGGVKFVPLVAAAPTFSASEQGDAGGVIEVEIGAAKIRIQGRVDRPSLENVFAAVRASA
jgi:transposase